MFRDFISSVGCFVQEIITFLSNYPLTEQLTVVQLPTFQVFLVGDRTVS